MLLAYFDIALISITIANYAVSASFLGRESRLSRQRMERREQELLDRLKGLRETTQIESIRNEIKQSGKEKRGLSVRIRLLSWLGAVILPSTFFIISLICSILGMNAEVVWSGAYLENLNWLIGASALFISVGFSILLVVIRTIDSAARKVPIPGFEVCFPDRTNKSVLKRNQQTEIEILITNKGEDIAENMQIFVTFPNAFKILGRNHYESYESDPLGRFPNCIYAMFKKDLLHIQITTHIYISVTAPNVNKEYETNVQILEKKIGSTRSKLFIEVID